MDEIFVCRRVSDNAAFAAASAQDNCDTCGEPVFVEKGLGEGRKVCIHCAVKSHRQLCLFVELPPDEFGHSSLAKGITEVYAKDDGEWHKHGLWHNQKWVLARQE